MVEIAVVLMLRRAVISVVVSRERLLELAVVIVDEKFAVVEKTPLYLFTEEPRAIVPVTLGDKALEAKEMVSEPDTKRTLVGAVKARMSEVWL